MCLDIKYIYNNQGEMKTRTESNGNSVKDGSSYDVPIKCLCGGSLVDHKPVFDPKGE
jgi:hypothetical protein